MQGERGPMNDAKPTEAADVEALFNNPKADVILRSSDSVDFRTFKLLLSLASSFFDAMFALPQPTDESGESKDGLPVILLAENSVAIRSLLRFCYPVGAVDPPTIETLEEAMIVLEPAMKYTMEGVEKMARRAFKSPHLLRADSANPMRVFAIAVRYRMQDEARVAAQHMLSVPLAEWPLVDEMKYITGIQYYQLLRYRMQCEKVSGDVARSTGWIPSSLIAMSSCTSCPPGERLQFEAFRQRKWWSDYLKAAEVELKRRPCGEVVLLDILDQALQSATACIECGPQALTKMRALGEKLSAEVERLTSEVKLDIND